MLAKVLERLAARTKWGRTNGPKIATDSPASTLKGYDLRMIFVLDEHQTLAAGDE